VTKKGIILAGGQGTRLSPLTKVVNKQLLPLYDKPTIFYPLSVLMLANIKDILIITNPNEDNYFKKILGYGSDFGIKLNYAIQQKPKGLSEAFIIGEKFIEKQKVAMILGDNFFFGQGFTHKLSEIGNSARSTIFLYPVKNPENYGVVYLKKNKINKIEEKPKKPKTNLAIAGLYFFDENVSEYAKKLKPSKRRELEIVDMINIYKKKKKLHFKLLGRGSTWLDTGSIESLYEASQFISNIEKRQGLKIACIEEIALEKKWIKKKNIEKRIKFYGKCEYSNYLKELV